MEEGKVVSLYPCVLHVQDGVHQEGGEFRVMEEGEVEEEEVVSLYPCVLHVQDGAHKEGTEFRVMEEREVEEERWSPFILVSTCSGQSASRGRGSSG